MTVRAELVLVRSPTAADLVALFELITGRPATEEERLDVEAFVNSDAGLYAARGPAQNIE